MPPNHNHAQATNLAIPINPLVTARLAHAEDVQTYARRLNVHKALVQFAEQGCYRRIPPVYLRKNEATAGDFPAYHNFRIVKRRTNFQRIHFPPEPPKSFQALLSYLQLKPYQFACRLCVQPAEIQRLKTPISRLPLNVFEALTQVGLSLDYVQRFEKNLNRNTQQRTN